MFASARQGLRLPRLAAAAIHSPLPLPFPPAESSRQAQARVAGRRYTAAAAERVVDSASPASGSTSGSGSGPSLSDFQSSSSPDTPSLHPSSSPSSAPQPSHPTSSIPNPSLPDSSLPAPPSRHQRQAQPGRIVPVDAPQTAGERFARHVKIDSIEALRQLGYMTPEELAMVQSADVRRVLYWSQKDIRNPESPLQNRITPKEANKSLCVVRAMLLEPPQVQPVVKGVYKGQRLKGAALRGLLRLAINMGSRRFAKETLTERLEEQVRTKKTRIVDTTAIAIDMAAAEQWDLIAELFPGPSELLPQRVWSSILLGIVIRANMALGRPQAAVDIFHEVKDTSEIEAPALCALIQAYLQLGDIPAAQQAADYAHKNKVPYGEVQLAILRGYRALGFDADLEERVRRGFEKLHIPLEAPVLNAFIRLRMDAGDYDGAEQILREFRIDGRRAGAHANVSTAVLALTLHMRHSKESFDIAKCARMWNGIVHVHHDRLSNLAVSQLCHVLAQFGRSDEVHSLVRGAVDKSSTTKLRFKLPPTFTPSIVLLNTALEICVRAQGYEGLVNVTDLMTKAGIEPNDHTVVIVLEFAARNLTASPPALARLLAELNTRSETPPTADQVVLIVTEAVRASMRDPTALTAYFDSAPDGTAQEGVSIGGPTTVMLRGKLHALLKERISHLKTKEPSFGRTLRTRLMYDALALGPEPASKNIRSTWQAFVMRGYRPTAAQYLSLLRAYAEVGAFEDAEGVIALVEQDGLRPTTPMYTALIAMYRRARDVPRARKWYDAARPVGIDAAALAEMINTHCLAGQYTDAVELAHRDYAKVTMDDGALIAIAHALRRNKNVPGAVFFIAHHTRRRDLPELEGGRIDPKPVASPIPAARDPPPSPSPSLADAARPTLPLSVRYVLTPRLREVVRKMTNYLKKADVDMPEAPAALQLANEMLQHDAMARPKHIARAARLGTGTIVALADRAAAAAELDKVPFYRF